MEITGTVEASDGSQERLSATYDEAHAALLALLPEGHKLIVIRTDS